MSSGEIISSVPTERMTITFVVGQEEKEYRMSKSVLCDSLDVFRIGLQQSQHSRVLLRTMTPKVFELLLQWINDPLNINFEETREFEEACWRLRITAEVWRANDLKNYVTDVILIHKSYAMSDYKLTEHGIKEVWRYSTPGSAIRKLCIQCLAWEMQRGNRNLINGRVASDRIINALRLNVDIPDDAVSQIREDFDSRNFPYRYLVHWRFKKRSKRLCFFHVHTDIIDKENCKLVEEKDDIDDSNDQEMIKRHQHHINALIIADGHDLLFP